MERAATEPGEYSMYGWEEIALVRSWIRSPSRRESGHPGPGMADGQDQSTRLASVKQAWFPDRQQIVSSV